MSSGPIRRMARAAWVAMVLAAAPAVAQVWTGSGQSLDELRYRLSVIDAELAQIRAQLGEGSGAPTRGAPAPAAGGEVLVRLDRLEAELRRLTGRVEALEFAQKQMAEDAARRFTDIEFRLTELEGGDVSAVRPVPPLAGGGSATGGGTVAGDGRDGAVAVAPEVSVSERADLDRAITDVRQGRFDVAEDRLREFLTSYPGSPLASEAYLWLGEAQFVRGAVAEAAKSHLDGYKAAGPAEMRARNLYRLGVALGRLGQIKEACLTLREVDRQFPGAPADLRAAAAAEREKLRCG